MFKKQDRIKVQHLLRAEPELTESEGIPKSVWF